MELPSKLEEYLGGLVEIVHPGGDIEYGKIVDVSQSEESVTFVLKNRIKRNRKSGDNTWTQVDITDITIDSSYKTMSIGQGRLFLMTSGNCHAQYTLFQPDDAPANFPKEYIPPKNTQR